MLIKSESGEIENYLNDASNLVGGWAERVFLPESEADVSEFLKHANKENIPVTVSGARTGTVGGAIPFGGYVISLERLNRIKKIDKSVMTAVVEPGVILADFQKAVDEAGLFYPPDPTEWSCQIGGTVATNASGARSFKYGASRRYVIGLNIILADGDSLRLKRGERLSENDGRLRLLSVGGREIALDVPTFGRPNVRKNASGYYNERPLDAIDLFIGSEGTLGVITEIEVRLLTKPQGAFSGIVFFKDNSDLLRCVDEIRRVSFDRWDQFQGNDLLAKSGGRENGAIDAALLEYFDDRSLNLISEKFPETPCGMAGAIFFEQETAPETEDELLAAWDNLFSAHNADLERSWFTTNEWDREKMREFRHALPISVNERVVRNHQKKVGTDMAVPDENFAGFLRYYKDILDSCGIDYVIFGHIGDSHLHANLLPKNEDEAKIARQIYGRCIAQAIMLGGCVSAEHGIGKMKTKYLYAMMGERYIHEMAAVKRVLDPNGILGRGNMLDVSFIAEF